MESQPIRIVTDNKDLERKLDDVIKKLDEILTSLTKKESMPEVAFQYKITSTNPAIELDATYYYDLSYILVPNGVSIPTDVLLYFNYLGGTSNSMRDLNNPGQMVAYLNSNISGNQTKGFRISKIWVDSTLPIGATIYVIGVGQKEPSKSIKIEELK
jgi:hypothetical protein